jgi:hypothetical protein
MNAGDTAFIAPGDYYTAQLHPIAGNSASDPTVYACSTADENSFNTATLWSGNVLSDWVDTVVGGNTLWKTDGTPTQQLAAWTSDEGGNKSYPCVVGGDSIYWPSTTLAGVDAAGKMHYRKGDDTLFIYPYNAAGTTDVKISADRVLFIGGASGADDHVEFLGLNFKMGFNAAVWIDGTNMTDSVSFIHCNIGHGLMRPSNNASVVFSAGTASPWYDHFVFRACTVYSATCGTTNPHDYFAGVGILMYGQQNWVIDSCYFYRCNGVGVYQKGAADTSRGLVVRNSMFDGTLDMPYGEESFSTAGVAIKCEVYQDSIYGNIFRNITYTAGGLISACINIAPLECASSYNHGDHFIAHNSMYNCARFLGANEGARDPTAASTLKNNVLYKFSASNSRDVHDHTGTAYAEAADWDIDYNFWGDPSYIWTMYDDGATRNFGYWQSTLGHDANGDTMQVTFDSTEAVNYWLGYNCEDCPTVDSLLLNNQWYTRAGAIQPTGGASGPSKAPFLR